MRKSRLRLVVLLTLGLTGIQGAIASPLHIRAAFVVPVANIGSILFAQKGIAKYEGKTYSLAGARGTWQTGFENLLSGYARCRPSVGLPSRCGGNDGAACGKGRRA
jgi:hypothetical protein